MLDHFYLLLLSEELLFKIAGRLNKKQNDQVSFFLMMSHKILTANMTASHRVTGDKSPKFVRSTTKVWSELGTASVLVSHGFKQKVMGREK